jgi:hypothetical protein
MVADISSSQYRTTGLVVVVFIRAPPGRFIGDNLIDEERPIVAFTPTSGCCSTSAICRKHGTTLYDEIGVPVRAFDLNWSRTNALGKGGIQRALVYRLLRSP